MDQPPLVFPGHWIGVAFTEVANVTRLLQFIHCLGELLVLRVVKLHGAFVLFAPLNQHLFFIALRLEGGAGKLNVQRDRQCRSQSEDEQQGKAGLLRAAPHPGCSSSGRVC